MAPRPVISKLNEDVFDHLSHIGKASDLFLILRHGHRMENDSAYF